MGRSQKLDAIRRTVMRYKIAMPSNLNFLRTNPNPVILGTESILKKIPSTFGLKLK